jgi:lambda family phage tail tape measure protein
MATRNIGTLTLDVVAKINGFEQGMDAAERRAQRLAGTLEKTTAAGAEGFRKMAEQSQNLARLSETTKTFLDPGDTSSRWAKNAAAFDKAHEAAKKLVEDGERMKVWKQAFEQTETQDAFLRGLRNTAEAAGKTRAQLLELQAARSGLDKAGQAEAARLIAQIAATDKVSQGFRRTGQLTANELQNVAYQVQDFFVQVSSGQSVLTAFIQQGAQLQGQFGGAGKAIEALTSLITPMRLAIGGAAAALGLLAYGAKQMEDLSRSLGAMQAVLTATGRRELLPGLADTIKELARLPGVSRDVATQAVDALVRIPQLAGPIFNDLTKIVGDYARVTGKELPDAAKDLGQAFADPARGAEQLDKVLGNLRAETIVTVKQLAELGDTAGAQRVLFEDVSRIIAGLADNGLTPLQKSVNELKDSWEDLKDTFRNSGVFEAILSDVSGLIRMFKQDVDDIRRAVEFFNSFRPQRPDFAGAWEGSSNQPTQESIDAANKQLKAVMGVAAGYETAGKKAERLLLLQQQIVRSLGAAQATGALGPEAQARAIDQIKAIQQQIDSGNKKGSKEKAYQDDAAQRQLLSLREQEAALKAQLVAVEGLTSQQQELAKFEQQIADLKEKKVLTADQKILLQNEDQLRLQLQINSALSVGLQAKEDAAKAAKKEAAELQRQADAARRLREEFDATVAAIGRSVDERNRSSAEGYADLLAGAGSGRQARQQILEQIAIRRTFDKEMRRLNEEAIKGGFLGTDKYNEGLAKIQAGFDEALRLNRDFWAEWKRAQGDWRVGASEAMNNYLDEVADIAAQTNNLFSGMFKGAEDALVQFVTTGKLDFKNLADFIVAEVARMGIRQNITGPLSEMLTKGATGGGVITDFLSGLLGGGKTAVAAATVASTTNTAAMSAMTTAVTANIAAMAALSAAAQSAAAALASIAASSTASSVSSAFGAVGSATWSAALGELVGLAGGGPAYAGSAYLVGEDGPELFMPRTSGTVIPTGQTAAMLGGKSIVYSPVFHIPAPTDMRTQQQIAAKAFSGFQMAAARHT